MTSKAAIKPFKWTLLAYRAASILGCAVDHEGAKQEAAEAVGKTTRTIENWQRHPDFAAMVDGIRAEFARKALGEVEGKSLADFKTRMDALDRLNNGLATIIQERAESHKHGEEPGVATGLLRLIIRRTGKGEDVEVTEEFVLDKDTVTAQRDIVMAAHKMVMDVQGQAGGDERVTYEFVAD